MPDGILLALALLGAAAFALTVWLGLTGQLTTLIRRHRR
jgi:hypothetical protein